MYRASIETRTHIHYTIDKTYSNPGGTVSVSGVPPTGALCLSVCHRPLTVWTDKRAEKWRWWEESRERPKGKRSRWQILCGWLMKLCGFVPAPKTLNLRGLNVQPAAAALIPAWQHNLQLLISRERTGTLTWGQFVPERSEKLWFPLRIKHTSNRSCLIVNVMRN